MVLKAMTSVSVLLSSLGGHTTEILRLTGALSLKYSPRCYVVANTDNMSETKIASFESSRKDSEKVINSWCAKLFSRNIDMYLQFLSFLHTDMIQVIVILHHVRQGPT